MHKVQKRPQEGMRPFSNDKCVRHIPLTKFQCDETAPHCQRCQRRGNECQYPENHRYNEQKDQTKQRTLVARCIESLESLTCSPFPCTLALIDQSISYNSLVPSTGSVEILSFGLDDLNRLHFFQSVTCATLGTHSVQDTYRSEILRLAISVSIPNAFCQHRFQYPVANIEQRPYLMHTVLALTRAHHRQLVNSSFDATLQEQDQIALALSQYSARLSFGITAEDADALLATSTLINGFYFASVRTADPSKSWPLVSSPTDLQWIGAQQGPRLIMAGAAQWLSQGVFASAFSDFDPDISSPRTLSEDEACIDARFRDLCAFCDAGPDSNGNNDQHYRPYLVLLATFLHVVPCTSTMARYLPFISSLEVDFIDRLRVKDTRALLILAWWYALICPLPQWWLAVRARTECVAICMFLELTEASPDLQELLDFPARRCGYIT